MTLQPKNLRERSSLNWCHRLDVTKKSAGRHMTARELRLDMECDEAPEPSVIYADIDADGEFTAVTIISRSE